MTREEANEIIFNPLGYHISGSGGLYRFGGSKIGICAFAWGHPLDLTQVNILRPAYEGPHMKEVQALCLLHDIPVKTLENS